MNILIIGSNGQLGSEFFHIKKPANIKFLSPNSSELDITNMDTINNFFQKNHIDIVLNFSGYTNVEKAEEDFLNANKINNLGVKNISDICNLYNSFLVHISTDYVFGCNQKGPFKASDKTSPINNYGLSKELGENSIIKNSNNALIIRVASLFGLYRNNFLKNFINILINHKKINIIYDQMISVTYSYDLAKFILKFIENYTTHKDTNNSGVKILHVVNQGFTTWFDVVNVIANEIEIFNPDLKSIKINKIKSKDWPSKVKRPLDSRIILSDFKNLDFPFKMPKWEESLRYASKEYLKGLDYEKKL
tara:strand:+ start:4267 stop:5184 length:918 start_codon:yes stop_codon:yes gene_type:complete